MRLHPPCAAAVLAGSAVLLLGAVTPAAAHVSLVDAGVASSGSTLELRFRVQLCGDPAEPAGDGHEAAGDATGGLDVSGAWVRPTMMPGSPTAAYLTIRNDGDVDDAIVGVSSPAAAVIELHQTTTAADGTMGMGPVAEVPIPAHGEAVLEPGGYHLMLIEPTTPLVAGDEVELTITFARAEPVTVSASVGDGAPQDGTDHMGHESG